MPAHEDRHTLTITSEQASLTRAALEAVSAIAARHPRQQPSAQRVLREVIEQLKSLPIPPSGIQHASLPVVTYDEIDQAVEADARFIAPTQPDTSVPVVPSLRAGLR